MDFEYDCDCGPFDGDSLQAEIALEMRQEWDWEAEADRELAEADEFGQDDDYDESMDGAFDSAMISAGFGIDEDYGDFGGHDDW